MKKHVCKICGNANNNKIHVVKEMMFGFNDEFEYIECSNCGCLQIVDIPKNMEKYYPPDYYSYFVDKPKLIKKYIRRIRDNYILFKKGGIIGKILSKIFPDYRLNRLAKLSEIGYSLNFDMRILDVGCGSGSSFLIHLENLGFTELYGVDPYIKHDIIRKNIRIYKKDILQLKEHLKYDIIVFHHSLEHMANQLQVLKKVSKLLSDRGVCIIATPIKSNYIWNKYGTNWVQIDAPRHFFIHTVKSLTYLAEKAGLKLKYIYYDSTEFQFLGSEQYLKNIPLKSERSYKINFKKSIFSKKDVKKYKNLAKYLNEINQGDQAVFYFIKEGHNNENFNNNT